MWGNYCPLMGSQDVFFLQTRKASVTFTSTGISSTNSTSDFDKIDPGIYVFASLVSTAGWRPGCSSTAPPCGRDRDNPVRELICHASAKE